MNSSSILFILLVVFLTTCIILMIIRLLKKPVQHNKHLDQLARDLGIQVLHKQAGTLTHDIEGMYKGKIIKIYSITVKTDGFRTMRTAIRLLGPNPLYLTFKIVKHTWIRNFDKLLGYKRLRFADVRFDQRFVVKSNQPEIMKSILTDSIRSQFLEIENEFDYKGGMELEDNTIVYLEHEPIDNERKRNRFEAITNLMCCIRDELDNYLKEK